MANRTLREKGENMMLLGTEQRALQGTTKKQWPQKKKNNSPRLLHRETVDSQHPPQCILGAVHNVLLGLVVQLLLHDVLAQVEHHLQVEHNCSGWRSRLEV